jgi:hypothetical protein
MIPATMFFMALIFIVSYYVSAKSYFKSKNSLYHAKRALNFHLVSVVCVAVNGALSLHIALAVTPFGWLSFILLMVALFIVWRKLDLIMVRLEELDVR